MTNRIFLPFLILLISRSAFTETKLNMSAEELQKKFADNSGAFALDLYSSIIEEDSDTNIIVSPFSIQTCVALAFAGAGGKTAEEMYKGLHLVSDDRNVVADTFQSVLDVYKNSPLLKIANKFYVQLGSQVKDEFNLLAKKKFHSEAANLDFAEKTKSAGVMNQWVEAKTNGKIKNLISPDSLGGDTRMVLINAIHFKGEWKNKFDKDATKQENFWISETESIKVDMMNHKKNYRYGVLPELDATALEMPYKDSDLSMLVILPNTKTGLKTLEQKIKNMKISEITDNMYPSDVIVKFPKFKVEFKIELTKVLSKLGMGTMFSNSADFSNLLKSPEPLKVSEVIHKGFIEVNEEGAEAAAATVVQVRKKRSLLPQPPEIIEFFVQQPFLFFIKDQNKNISLFAGSIKNNIHIATQHENHNEL